jgi:hypothetical protein
MKECKYVVRGTVKLTKWVGDYEESLDKYEAEAWFDEINEVIDEYGRDNLAEYLDENGSLYGIVTDIRVGIERVCEDDKNALYSRTEITSTQELSEAQKAELLEYLTGQFSDGYGEGLEQQEFDRGIEIEESEEWDEEEQEIYMSEYEVECYKYFHLWQHRDFEIYFVNPESISTPAVSKPKKPKCKLIGEDGNIFNLIGIASRELKRAGMHTEAKEMSEKCMRSGSYSEALSIIMEYVEVE